MLRPFKFVGLISFIGLFLGTSAAAGPFVRCSKKKVKVRQKIAGFYNSIGLKILGVKINIDGQLPKNSEVFFVVSNHLSYLDIMIIMSVLPVRFVTSMEIKHTPGLGKITDLSSCLYVERRSRSNLGGEINEIGEALKGGFNVVVFPEATSTNGESVLRFKRPLFKSAIQTETPVLPLCLNYRQLDSKGLNHENRDDVFWYGDMDFISHLWQVLKYRRIDVDLKVMQPLHPREKPTPDDLSQTAHQLVSSAFVPVTARSSMLGATDLA